MTTPKLDCEHCDNIRRVLHALVGSNADTPHAILACEDTYVALSVGLACGMTVDRVYANVELLLTQDGTVEKLKQQLAGAKS